MEGRWLEFLWLKFFDEIFKIQDFFHQKLHKTCFFWSTVCQPAEGGDLETSDTISSISKRAIWEPYKSLLELKICRFLQILLDSYTKSIIVFSIFEVFPS